MIITLELILVGIGGICGSLARYWLGKFISSHSKRHIPVGTFLINSSGAILLGLISGANPSRNLSLLFCDGFLGAYTTFSTFMYEGFCLFQDKKTLNALTYILGSLFLGIAGYEAGTVLSGFFAH